MSSGLRYSGIRARQAAEGLPLLGDLGDRIRGMYVFSAGSLHFGASLISSAFCSSAPQEACLSNHVKNGWRLLVRTQDRISVDGVNPSIIIMYFSRSLCCGVVRLYRLSSFRQFCFLYQRLREQPLYCVGGMRGTLL